MATLAQKRGLAVRRLLGPPGRRCGPGTRSPPLRPRGVGGAGGALAAPSGAREPGARRPQSEGVQERDPVPAFVPPSPRAGPQPSFMPARSRAEGIGLRAARKAPLWEVEGPRELQEPPLVAIRPRCSSWAARRNLGNKPAQRPGRSEAAGAGASALGLPGHSHRGRLQTFLGKCASQAPSPWSFVLEDWLRRPTFPRKDPTPSLPAYFWARDACSNHAVGA